MVAGLGRGRRRKEEKGEEKERILVPALGWVFVTSAVCAWGPTQREMAATGSGVLLHDRQSRSGVLRELTTSREDSQ